MAIRSIVSKFASDNTYIGKKGEVFYNTVTKEMRISDGRTPGGTIIGGSGGTDQAFLNLTNDPKIVQPISVGTGTTFTKQNNADPLEVFDTIDTGLSLTRGTGQGLYNISEVSYNRDVSPVGTLWNADGWSDLSDYMDREYVSLYLALDQRIGDNIVGSELIMHDTINNRYYTFKFSSWTSGNVGGGFSYERKLINDPNIFRRESFSNTRDIIIPGEIEIIRGNSGGIYNAITESGWASEVSPEGTLWNSDGWADLSNIEERSYVSFNNAVGDDLGRNVFNSDFVMFIPSSGQYFLIKFLSWAMGENGNPSGGGFSYLRYAVDLDQVIQGITFPDGTKQNTAYIPTDVIATHSFERKILTRTGESQAILTERIFGDSILATSLDDREDTDLFYFNYDEALYTAFNNSSDVIPIEVSSDNGITWLEAEVNGASFENWIQVQFVGNTRITVTTGQELLYRTIEGGFPVRWLRFADNDFRGAIVDYHMYSQRDGTIIGTIWMADDINNPTFSHIETLAGSSSLDEVQPWLRYDDADEIYVGRLDTQSDTVYFQWTAKIFIGDQQWD